MKKINKRLTKQDKVMIKYFINFLRKHDALVPFCCNLALLKNMSLSDYMQRRAFASVLGKSNIVEAFTWSYTKEGHNWWSRLSYDWEDSALDLKYNM